MLITELKSKETILSLADGKKVFVINCHDDVDAVNVRHLGLQQLDRVGFVVLDHNKALLGAYGLEDRFQAVDHVVRELQKHSVVGGQERLALAAVQENGVDRLVRLQLDRILMSSP